MIKRKNKRFERIGSPYFFIIPSLFVIVLFIGFPILLSFYLSLTEYNYVYSKKPDFILFKNYFDLFRDENFVTALKNTFYYVFLFFPSMIILSLLVAWLLNQNIPGVIFFRTLCLLPIVVPLSLSSVIFIWIYANDFGILNHFLGNILGLRRLTHNWLIESKTALPSIVLVGLWKYLGFGIVMFLAGLKAISQDLYDSAMIDGANRWKTFIYITLPNLKESFIIVGIWGIINSIKVLEQPFIMTRGGPGNSTLLLYLYLWRNGFQYFEMGYAASIAYLIGAIIFLFSILIIVLLRTERK